MKFALILAGTCGATQGKSLMQAMQKAGMADDVSFVYIVTNEADSVHGEGVINIAIGKNGTGSDQTVGAQMWAQNVDTKVMPVIMAKYKGKFEETTFIGVGSVAGGSGAEIMPGISERIHQLGGFMYNVVSLPLSSDPTDHSSITLIPKQNAGKALRNFYDLSSRTGTPVAISFANGSKKIEQDAIVYDYIMSVIVLYRELDKKAITGFDGNDVRKVFTLAMPNQPQTIRIISFSTANPTDALANCATGIVITAEQTPPPVKTTKMLSYKDGIFTSSSNELLLLHAKQEGAHKTITLSGNDVLARSVTAAYIQAINEERNATAVLHAEQQAEMADLFADMDF